MERPADEGLAAHVSSLFFPVYPQAFDIQMTQKWNLQVWGVARSLHRKRDAEDFLLCAYLQEAWDWVDRSGPPHSTVYFCISIQATG